MFSVKEKQYIAEQIEKLLLDLNHPEMPKSRPVFRLHVQGEEGWSWADIDPNWAHDNDKRSPNPFNEVSRKIHEV